MQLQTIAIDVETTKKPIMHPWQQQAALVSVCVAREDKTTKTWIFNHSQHKPTQSHREMVQEIQREIDKAGLIVGHNVKFDLNWLRFLGLQFDSSKIWCTEVVEYLLRGQKGLGELHLSDLSSQYLFVPKGDKVKLFWDAGWETTDIPLEILLPYGEQDAINALSIFQHQAAKVEEEKMSALVGVQCELVRVLSDIEFNGIGWDEIEAGKQISSLRRDLSTIDSLLRDSFKESFNFNSGLELSVALYGGSLKRESTEWVIKEYKDHSRYFERKCLVDFSYPGAGFKPPKDSALKRPGFYSVDKDFIDQLRARTDEQKEIKELLQKRSKIKKALETLVGKNEESKKGLINRVQSDGRIHASYNQTVVKTGRLSSSKPNLQNQPRKKTSALKHCFISILGKLVSVDLSQIEWRICAFLCQDKTMLWEINHGIDAHRENAINILGADPDSPDFEDKRTIAKIITFRLIYGGSAYGFYKDQKMPLYTLKRWEEIVAAFYAKYPGLKIWQDATIQKVYENNGILRSITGRKFVFDQVQKYNRATGETMWVFDERQIKNWPVQSLATADIMPLAMIIIHKAYRQRNLKSRLVAQVHDNLVWDCPTEEIEKISELCLTVFERMPAYIEQVFGFKINVPISGTAEIGDRWATLIKR